MQNNLPEPKTSVILIKTHYNATMSCHQYHIFKKIGI